MSSNITNISHGQTNWDTVVNQNFKNLDTDSGWVDIPLLAPFQGWLKLRTFAHAVEIVSSINTTDFELTQETTLANLPSSIKDKHIYQVYFNSFIDGSNTFARCHIDDDCNLSIVSTTADLQTKYLRISKMISI